MASRSTAVSRPPALARSPLAAATWGLIIVASLATVYIEGRSGYEAQMFLVVCAVISIAAAFLLPKAVRKEPSVALRFLAFALAAHLVGSLLRYFIIQAVYHGVADANGYYGTGKVFASQFRTLNFPPLPYPYFGTPFINWTTGILFAFTGPTMLGAFAIHAALAFVGGWYFYKAFRLSFPDGDHKLYAFLVFLMPSMWYWPSSLGKDSLVVLFLGMATYGFALVLRAHFLRGFVVALFGLVGTFMIRPPIAAALAVAGAAAFLLRPARGRSAAISGLTWVVFVPVLALVAFVTVKHTSSYLGNKSPVEAFQAQQALEFNGGLHGSNFSPPNPFTPLGFPKAVITTNFRPFPWEAGGLLPALTSLEGVLIAGLIFVRRREIFRGLGTWRDNGMVVLAFAAFLAFSVILSALSNYGLLARERTQVLPFLFMLIAMSARRRPGNVPAGQPMAVPALATRP